ncbi:MAG: carboxypeptidase regulatory-like domain-containing protein [bacterium]
MHYRLLLALTCALASTAAAQAPTRHERIRGTVTDSAGKPIPGAEVIATRAPDRAFKSATSGAAGDYSIDWPEGTGDYLVHASAVGYEAFRKRATNPGTDSVLTLNISMKAIAKVQELAAVVTTARKPKPTRNPPFGADVGAAEQQSGGLNGTISPDLAGDLSAIAGTLPGVQSTTGGISVLGLGADQNSTTLNGMSFPGADVPRDANTRVRVSTSAYDPSRGWFSGANTNVELAPGQQFGNRRSHITLDAPALEYTDPISAQLGQRFTNAQLSVGEDGEMVEDKWYYNMGLQGGRRYASVASLLSADANLLQRANLSPDSASRLQSLVRGLGIPVSATTSSISDNASFIGRFDHTPFDPVTLGPAQSTWGLTTYAKASRTTALNASPASVPAHRGETSQQIGSLQGQYSRYFRDDWLADARSSLSITHNATTPYVALPDARVLIQSDFGNALGEFGGNANLDTDSKNWTWENAFDMQFYANNTPAHRVKLSGDARLDGYSQAIAPNTLGTFSYNSLADLAANNAVSFTRTLNAPERTGAEWNAFLALSDLWRISPNWQVLYGARLEGNAFTKAPLLNADVQQRFGARTDFAPNGVAVSPRFGFTYNRTGQIRNGVIGNNLGNFTGTTPGVLRGGFGEFRGLTPATLLSGAMANTGLAGAQSRLSCIGAAVPQANWASYLSNSASIPTSCVGGASTFADAAPNVTLFDPSWSTARSWRGNLTWQSVFSKFKYTLEGLYSLNLGQPGLVDLNFADTPKFTLATEGRTIFAPSADIVPASGLVGTSNARIASQYGRVLSVRGDGRSVSKQATLTVSPNLFGGGFNNFYISGAYTISSINALQRGFDATTFNSPSSREWARGALDARHQFLFTGAYAAANGLTVSLLGRLQSGLPFTPLIATDVNGDGIPNDRAFVANSPDLQKLIASSTGNVQQCLNAQMGKAAAAQSCEGPWTATLNARLGYSLNRRTNIGLNFSNPLGGLDQLIHGSENLRGWGAMAAPDPTLYTVRGYDAPNKAFQYSVNPRFGDSRPTANTLRAPFRLTLDVSIDIGRPTEEQQVDRWLRPGRAGRSGLKADVQELRRRYAGNVPDMYQMLLQQADSLLLSREQVESLTKSRAAYRTRLDSLWTTLATHLANLPDSYDPHDAYTKASEGIDSAWEMTRDDLQKSLPNVLNPVQMQLLPSLIRNIIDSKGPLHIRVYITGG